jgi:hypothetical protein
MASYDDPRFHAALLDALASHLTTAFARSTAGIAAGIGLVAAEALRNCPEYAALVGGELRGELGAVSARRVLEAVCKNIAGGVRVASLGVRRSGAGLEGGMRIGLVKGDYSEVLGVDGGTFTSEKGFDVPWLRWLTLEGDAVLVADHHFLAKAAGRTGRGVMVPTGVWRVPAEYAGTAEDNWILRALRGIGADVTEVIAREVQRNV